MIRAFRAGGRYADIAPVGFEAWCDDPRASEMLILKIAVKGKLMWWRLGPEDDATDSRWHMLCTYGMTGGWTVRPLSEITHPAFVFSFDPRDDETLTFDDQRHFGTLKFVKGDAPLTQKLASLGPDMLAAPPDSLGFAQRLLRRPHATLAEVLMDQSVVSGIGNYLKAESLWLARLSPHRTVLSLSGAEHDCLRDAIVHTMTMSYSLGGATIVSYRDPDGHIGGATSRFACYGRANDLDGEPVIVEETKDGRTTWWVPTRQR